MNKLIHALIALTILIGTPAMADSKAEALEVIHQWINAVNRNDIDGVVATFATDASFFGTTTKTVINSSDGIREYFKTVYAKFAPLSVGLGQFTVSELSADSAVFTGYDKWQVTVSDKPVEGVGRLSIAVARRAGQWRIVSFHRSAMPN